MKNVFVNKRLEGKGKQNRLPGNARQNPTAKIAAIHHTLSHADAKLIMQNQTALFTKHN